MSLTGQMTIYLASQIENDSDLLNQKAKYFLMISSKYFQGLTVTTDEAGKVIVARIIIDSVIERQGLLRPGDLILEANNNRVKTPEQLQNLIEASPEFLTLKIQPTLSVSQSLPLNNVEKVTSLLPNKVRDIKP